MGQMQAGWAIQQRVIVALVRRELATRFGRENIGFLWMMAEPLLFPALVALGWRLLRGPSEHGLSVIAFVVTGYVPLTLFRHAVGRSVGVFSANSGLLYHRQIGLVDLIFVRVLIEVVGAMMAYVGIAGLLIWCGAFPVPADMVMLVAVCAGDVCGVSGVGAFVGDVGCAGKADPGGDLCDGAVCGHVQPCQLACAWCAALDAVLALCRCDGDDARRGFWG